MYLDLNRYRKYVDDLAQTPFTPAVSTYFALDAACEEFLADGRDQRLLRYRIRNARLRAGLAQLGAYPLTQTGRESHSVVTVSVPNGIEFADFYERLKLRGFIVYGCKSVLEGRFFQVANMGEVSEDVIDSFLRAAKEVIGEIRCAATVAMESRALQPNLETTSR